MKKILITLMAVLSGMVAQAQFAQFAGPNGYMNVFNLAGDTYLFGSGWGVPDLQAITTDNETFVLKPNINTYDDNPGDAYWRNNGGAGPDGAKTMDAACFYERTIEVSDTSCTLTFDVSQFNLDGRYKLEAFVKVLKQSDNSYANLSETRLLISGTASNQTINIPVPFTGELLQAGFIMFGINANGATDWGSATVTITELVVDTGDVSPPDPETMTFAIPPQAVSDQSISMTAATATDVSGVEYYFSNVSGGGNDSGWQTDPTYVDSGLSANTLYSYTVIARDLSANKNSNNVSSAVGATTNPTDVDAPSPAPEIVGMEVSSITVLLTSSIAPDASAVEYLFANTTTGTDSGWQSSPVYVDSGLAPSATYSYTVKARDLSVATNMTAVSAPVTVTTWSSQRSAQLVDSLKGYTGDSNQGTIHHQLAVAGWQIASNDMDRVIAFDSEGATFGSDATFLNRNTLRTLYEDYGDYDFEVYATFITSNTSEQAAFVGVGQGIVGNFGVPDLDLVGVNAIYAEMQNNFCKVFTQTNGLATADQTAGISTVTNRVRMVHDSGAQTVTFELDTDYNGTFVADRPLGTASTTNVWVDAPQRIYVAAGAGVLLKDIEISSDAPGFPIVLAINSDAAGQVLQWEGVPGQVYGVEWSDELVNPTWQEDTSVGLVQDMGGSMSVTSTVNQAEVFYRFIEQ